MKKAQQRFNVIFGAFLMVFGASVEIYDLLNTITTKPILSVYDLIVDFAIPLALIYCGYHISMQKPFQFPSFLKG